MKLTHIALHVPDAPACAKWYADYCGMVEVRRHGVKEKPVIWLAYPESRAVFVMVLIHGGPAASAAEGDFSHLGFSVESREDVDALAQRAREAGCLLWEPRDEPFPVGYYCGVLDPAGNQVEFSYGQPLG
ncbi:MAG: VOC family protein [Halieaceae bacterium]|jgi:catechol 2,3-dioxygenase-like lactoylglutathione lyase family enzyme|nr:VOC family protein [Halieaceae bacterium]